MKVMAEVCSAGPVVDGRGVVLSARLAQQQKVAALDAGADDYVGTAGLL
jgi:DNA-binding response OmpR family regulator